MNVNHANLFSQFESVIRALPIRERFDRADLLIPSLRLHQEASLEMYYAPFDSVNRSATIILVGITPGWTQMEIAYRVARHEIDNDTTSVEICRRAKQNASFAGTMRTNLIRMLTISACRLSSGSRAHRICSGRLPLRSTPDRPLGILSS